MVLRRGEISHYTLHSRQYHNPLATATRDDRITALFLSLIAGLIFLILFGSLR